MLAVIFLLQLFPADSWLSALPASILGGITAVLCQTPFDVVSTRMYNQGVDSNGRGLLYRGIVDCFVRMYKAEGIWGFYKGLGASMFRLGPHTVLTLVFWHQIQVGYKRFSERKVDGVAFKH
jgi:solute carrier family 25 protein 34/35